MNYDEALKLSEKSDKIEFHKLNPKELEEARKSLQEALEASGSPIGAHKDAEWKAAINDMHL